MNVLNARQPLPGNGRPSATPNSGTGATAVAVLGHVLPMAACDSDKPGGEDTGAVADLMEEDSSYSGFDCVEDFFFLTEDPIKNVYAFGPNDISPGDPPSDGLLISPCDIFGDPAPVDYYDTYIDDDVAVPANHWRVDFAPSGFICPDGGQSSGTFHFYAPFPSTEDCGDYGELSFEYDPALAAPPPPSGSGGEDSTTSACSAGSGRFKLYKYHWWDHDSDGHGIIRRFAVQTSGDVFPERAWIREIDVVSWGVASKLVFGKVGHWMAFSGDTLNTTNAVVVTSANPNPTFGTGVLTMGTYIAEDSFDLDDKNGSAPIVDIDWTCEVGSPPHYDVLSLPTLYGEGLDELGIEGIDMPHRLVAYLDVTNLVLHVSLEGRYRDGWQVKVHSVGGGYYSFDHRFSFNGVHVAGTVTENAQEMTVAFDTLEIGPVDLGDPTWELPAL